MQSAPQTSDSISGMENFGVITNVHRDWPWEKRNEFRMMLSDRNIPRAEGDHHNSELIPSLIVMSGTYDNHGSIKRLFVKGGTVRNFKKIEEVFVEGGCMENRGKVNSIYMTHGAQCRNHKTIVNYYQKPVDRATRFLSKLKEAYENHRIQFSASSSPAGGGAQSSSNSNTFWGNRQLGTLNLNGPSTSSSTNRGNDAPAQNSSTTSRFELTQEVLQSRYHELKALTAQFKSLFSNRRNVEPVRREPNVEEVPTEIETVDLCAPGKDTADGPSNRKSDENRQVPEAPAQQRVTQCPICLQAFSEPVATYCGKN